MEIEGDCARHKADSEAGLACALQVVGLLAVEKQGCSGRANGAARRITDQHHRSCCAVDPGRYLERSWIGDRLAERSEPFGSWSPEDCRAESGRDARVATQREELLAVCAGETTHSDALMGLMDACAVSHAYPGELHVGIYNEQVANGLRRDDSHVDGSARSRHCAPSG
jgi:hypothetical protein